jgi:hypothetical protein
MALGEGGEAAWGVEAKGGLELQGGWIQMKATSTASLLKQGEKEERGSRLRRVEEKDWRGGPVGRDARGSGWLTL